MDVPNGVHELHVLAVEVEASLSANAYWPQRPVADRPGRRVALIVVMCDERKQPSRLTLCIQQWPQRRVSALQLCQPQPRQCTQQNNGQEECIVLTPTQWTSCSKLA